MAYTPLIYLSADVEERLRSYLREELDNHDFERSEWLREIEKWSKLYWATPNSGAGAGPLQGGATLIVPLIAIAVETLQAKFLTKLFALDQFSSITLPDKWADIDSSLEKIVDHEFLTVGDIKEAADQCCLEFLKYGTCVIKTGYEYVKRQGIIYDLDDTELEVEIIKKGVCFNHVQLTNFLMPFAASDPQKAAWCGEEHTWTPFELKQMCESGLLYEESFEMMQAHFYDLNQSSLSPSVSVLQNAERMEKRQPLWPERVHIKEIAVAFDIGRKFDVELFVYYHRDSDKILGVRYNDRHDLSRPWNVKAYFPVEGRWVGIGQGKMGEQFQAEVTTQHRQRIDAISMAILRMFKTKRGSGISPDEPIFMGKIWEVDEMEDLDIIQTGEIYPSSFQGEQSAMLLHQQRSTVNEGTMGMPQVGTPGTAAGELGRVQEGTMRFDYVYNRFKDLLKKACLDGLCIIGKYGLRHEVILDQYPDGNRVLEFLSQSPDLIKGEVILKYNLVGQSQNRMIDRASWTQLSGILTQAYTNALQIAQQMGNQQLAQQIAQKALTANFAALTQILEAFDIRNINKISMSSQELQGATPTTAGPALPEIKGILPQPGMGLVNPINTTVGG
jgi:hypothetical protein